MVTDKLEIVHNYSLQIKETVHPIKTNDKSIENWYIAVFLQLLSCKTKALEPIQVHHQTSYQKLIYDYYILDNLYGTPDFQLDILILILYNWIPHY